MSKAKKFLQVEDTTVGSGIGNETAQMQAALALILQPLRAREYRLYFIWKSFTTAAFDEQVGAKAANHSVYSGKEGTIHEFHLAWTPAIFAFTKSSPKNNFFPLEDQIVTGKMESKNMSGWRHGSAFTEELRNVYLLAAKEIELISSLIVCVTIFENRA